MKTQTAQPQTASVAPEAPRKPAEYPDALYNKWTPKDTMRAADKSAPLGRCPKCKQPLRYYDGCLGYEAARCDACNFERDLNAEANGNPIEGEFTADKSAHTPETSVKWAQRCGELQNAIESLQGQLDNLQNNHDALVTEYNALVERTEANARLIAAAPDLLRELKILLTAAEILDGSETPEDYDVEYFLDACEKSRAAIAKAEGISCA